MAFVDVKFALQKRSVDWRWRLWQSCLILRLQIECTLGQLIDSQETRSAKLILRVEWAPGMSKVVKALVQEIELWLILSMWLAEWVFALQSSPWWGSLSPPASLLQSALSGVEPARCDRAWCRISSSCLARCTRKRRVHVRVPHNTVLFPLALSYELCIACYPEADSLS